MESSEIIRESAIAGLLETAASTDTVRVAELLAKARELSGLSIDEVAALCAVTDEEQMQQLFETARFVKESIYGRRLVLFAPLYVSNLCANECLYCAFRVRNTSVHRRALSQPEIATEVKALIDQGHKRVLLVAGESYPEEGFSYVLDAVKTIYSVTSGNGSIRRVNVNVAPLTIEEFRQLKAMNIGTYQLFQETYHHATYREVHLAGKKRDYDWRVTALDRAMEAGIDDVGIGVLFGLYDWRFELLALMQHVAWLEKKFGVGPHTISVPRIEPATGSAMASAPPWAVHDRDFKKIVAILRIAVPYTGIILSTRENADMRRAALSLGVSQISAGSRTNPGGYAAGSTLDDESQFSLGDHRSLDEVIRDIASMGYIPSFCTGCYRLGRTGGDFMDLAKPGEIKLHCDPNAIATFTEYLEDYASPSTKVAGESAVDSFLDGMEMPVRTAAEKMRTRIKSGERDVFC
jgi:2-iminoacetate synthase